MTNYKLETFEYPYEEQVAQYMTEYDLSRAEAEQVIALENYADRISDSACDCY